MLPSKNWQIMYQMDGKLIFFIAVQSCHRVPCTIRKHRRDEDAWGFTPLENLVYIFRGIIVSIFRLNVANKNQSDHNDWSNERKTLRGDNKSSKLRQTKCLKREETRVTMLQLVLILNLIGWECWRGIFWTNHDGKERKMELNEITGNVYDIQLITSRQSCFPLWGRGGGLTLLNRKVGKVIKIAISFVF